MQLISYDIKKAENPGYSLAGYRKYGIGENNE